MSRDRPPRPDVRRLRIAADLATVGLTLAIAVGLGIGLGVFLDRWLKTGGLMVIVGTLLGVVAGFQQLIRSVVRAGREQERLEAEERDRQAGK
jgi:F0F1-type ATP synthase assembly protein I